jgi:hypothetical protein
MPFCYLSTKVLHVNRRMRSFFLTIFFDRIAHFGLRCKRFHINIIRMPSGTPMPLANPLGQREKHPNT